MTKKAKNEVAVKKENLPAMMTDMEQDAMHHDSGIGAADTAIPFLKILQSLSPEVKKSSATRVADAEEGMLYNTVTQELAEELYVIPCLFRKANVEWQPRDEGGGWVGQHDSDAILAECTKNDKGQLIHNVTGHHIVPSMYYYCLVSNDEKVWMPVLISFSSTSQKPARRWNSLITQAKVQGKNGMFTPPMYGQVFVLGTEVMSNSHGDWYVPKITSFGLVSDAEIYRLAKDFNQQANVAPAQAPAPEQEELGTAY